MKRINKTKNILCLLFVLSGSVLLSGCEEKEPEFPETYRIEDVKEDEAVFVEHGIGAAWGRYNELTVFNKEGKVKQVNLDKLEPEWERSYDHMEDSEKLQKADEILRDEKIPFRREQREINEKEIEKCINSYDIEGTETPCDATDIVYDCLYVVCGTGNERRLVVMNKQGDMVYYSNSQFIREMSHKIMFGDDSQPKN